MNKAVLSNPVLLTSIALLAFAGNSILCRVALKDTDIDPASFSSIRILSGALVLTLILWIQPRKAVKPTLNKHSVLSAISLFIYATAFAFAYIGLSAATGALLLFGAVQLTMIAYAIWSGERLSLIQMFGLALACVGVAVLLLPSSTVPQLQQAIVMMIAGIAWGAYSILGKFANDATKTATDSFVLAIPLTLLLSLTLVEQAQLDAQGVIYAICSGAITSGLGYAIWYQVLPKLKSTVAATAQLSVPAITAIGGALFIGEAITLELILVTLTILSGIAMVTFAKTK